VRRRLGDLDEWRRCEERGHSVSYICGPPTRASRATAAAGTQRTKSWWSAAAICGRCRPGCGQHADRAHHQHAQLGREAGARSPQGGLEILAAWELRAVGFPLTRWARGRHPRQGRASAWWSTAA